MIRISLHMRLLLIACITGLAALIFAGLAIADVMQGMVRHNLDERLDAQISILERAVNDDGKLDNARLIPLRGFNGSMPGWGWQVSSAQGTWKGGEQIRGIKMRTANLREGQNRGRHHRRSAIGKPGSAHSQSGMALFVRERVVQIGAGPVRIIAAGPRRIAEKPLREAAMPLLSTLVLLGAALALATWAQLRFGLKPLWGLRAAIADIRKGKAHQLSEDQPKELLPLAQEVNALIDQNAAGLDHARAHVANLAHGLKTPLATLSLLLVREGASAEACALVTQLDKRIAHHLRRARSASAGAGERVRSQLGPIIADLFLAMGHVHADRHITLLDKSASDASIAVDREDMDEMLGNLLDNACRHACTAVMITTETDGQKLHILIEDDGPGIAEDQLAAALNPGTRLDESGTGYGFGLGIVRELAELYGGSLALEPSLSLGGLKVTLILPSAH